MGGGLPGGGGGGGRGAGGGGVAVISQSQSSGFPGNTAILSTYVRAPFENLLLQHSCTDYRIGVCVKKDETVNTFPKKEHVCGALGSSMIMGERCRE